MQGEIVDDSMEGAGVIRTGALVQQSGQHRAQSGFSRRVVRRSAAHGEFQSDERHCVALDEPDVYPSGRRQALDILGARANGLGGRMKSHRKSNLRGERSRREF